MCRCADGTLTVSRLGLGVAPLSGHEDAGTLVLTYDFPSGIQTSRHPNPGMPYEGTRRVGYLPDTPAGRALLHLFKRCFLARQTFTVGRSVTTGRDNCVVWNGVHHKTAVSGGETRFGYPDATYFERVRAELRSKGIEGIVKSGE